MNVIEVKNVTKEFKISSKQMKAKKLDSKVVKAVNNVTLNIKKGKIYGLLGPNGAGKTTTLRCITTLVEPTSGEIVIDGKTVKDDKYIRRKIGFLTGEIKLDGQFTPDYLFDHFGKMYEMSDEQIKKRKSKLRRRKRGYVDKVEGEGLGERCER